MLLNPTTKYFLYLTHREQTSTWGYCSIKACISLNNSLVSCVADSPQHTLGCSSVVVAKAIVSTMTMMAKESKYGCVAAVFAAWKPKTNTVALKSAERKNNMG